MSSSKIRKAIGAVKDQTSIGLAKVSSNISPDLDVAILKATSHDDDPADEKHIREILNLSSYSRGYANACVSTISRRLCKTRDWIVALKSLMLIHRLLNEKVPAFHGELLCATRRGSRLLNLSDFRDEAHNSSWDHSAFVRTYALFLDQRLDYIVRDKNSILNLADMTPEKVLCRMNELQKLFDGFLLCRPIGLAKNNRMIIVALCVIVRESFRLYAEICETLALLLDIFFDMEYDFCVKSFDALANAAKQIDELNAFYGWCKNAGVARLVEYPEVQRITDKLLETLEEYMRNRATRPNSSLSSVQEEEPALNLNSIKALPAYSDYEEPNSQIQFQFEGDLVDLREEDETASAVLFLPAADGAVQNIGGGDPFAASLSIPPPSYVQMCDIEKKQQLLMQEQQWWSQYSQGGITGQESLAKLNNAYYYTNPGIQYGMTNPAGCYYPNM